MNAAAKKTNETSIGLRKQAITQSIRLAAKKTEDIALNIQERVNLFVKLSSNIFYYLSNQEKQIAIKDNFFVCLQLVYVCQLVSLLGSYSPHMIDSTISRLFMGLLEQTRIYPLLSTMFTSESNIPAYILLSLLILSQLGVITLLTYLGFANTRVESSQVKKHSTLILLCIIYLQIHKWWTLNIKLDLLFSLAFCYDSDIKFCKDQFNFSESSFGVNMAFGFLLFMLTIVDHLLTLLFCSSPSLTHTFPLKHTHSVEETVEFIVLTLLRLCFHLNFIVGILSLLTLTAIMLGKYFYRFPVYRASLNWTYLAFTLTTAYIGIVFLIRHIEREFTDSYILQLILVGLSFFFGLGFQIHRHQIQQVHAFRFASYFNNQNPLRIWSHIQELIHLKRTHKNIPQNSIILVGILEDHQRTCLDLCCPCQKEHQSSNFHENFFNTNQSNGLKFALLPNSTNQKIQEAQKIYVKRTILHHHKNPKLQHLNEDEDQSKINNSSNINNPNLLQTQGLKDDSLHDKQSLLTFNKSQFTYNTSQTQGTTTMLFNKLQTSTNPNQKKTIKSILEKKKKLFDVMTKQTQKEDELKASSSNNNTQQKNPLFKFKHVSKKVNSRTDKLMRLHTQTVDTLLHEETAVKNKRVFFPILLRDDMEFGKWMNIFIEYYFENFLDMLLKTKRFSLVMEYGVSFLYYQILMMGNCIKPMYYSKKWFKEILNQTVFFRMIDYNIQYLVENQIKGKDKALKYSILRKDNLEAKQFERLEQFVVKQEIKTLLKEHVRDILLMKMIYYQNLIQGFNSLNQLYNQIIILCKEIENIQLQLLQNLRIETESPHYLRLLVIVSVWLQNDQILGRQYEKKLEEIARKDKYKDKNTIQSLTILKGNVVSIIASFRTKEGRILKYSERTPSFFGYNKVEFDSLETVNDIMPNLISQKHELFIDRFIDEGTYRILRTYRVTLARSKEGYILPVKVYINYFFEIHNDFVFSGLILKISTPSQFILVDRDGFVESSTEGFFNFLKALQPSLTLDCFQNISFLLLVTEFGQLLNEMTVKNVNDQLSNIKIEMWLPQEIDAYFNRFKASWKRDYRIKTLEQIIQNTQSQFDYEAFGFDVDINITREHFQLVNGESLFIYVIEITKITPIFLHELFEGAPKSRVQRAVFNRLSKNTIFSFHEEDEDDSNHGSPGGNILNNKHSYASPQKRKQSIKSSRFAKNMLQSMKITDCLSQEDDDDVSEDKEGMHNSIQSGHTLKKTKTTKTRGRSADRSPLASIFKKEHTKKIPNLFKEKYEDALDMTQSKESLKNREQQHHGHDFSQLQEEDIHGFNQTEQHNNNQSFLLNNSSSTLQPLNIQSHSDKNHGDLLQFDQSGSMVGKSSLLVSQKGSSLKKSEQLNEKSQSNHSENIVTISDYYSYNKGDQSENISDRQQTDTHFAPQTTETTCLEAQHYLTLKNEEQDATHNQNPITLPVSPSFTTANEITLIATEQQNDQIVFLEKESFEYQQYQLDQYGFYQDNPQRYDQEQNYFETPQLNQQIPLPSSSGQITGNIQIEEATHSILKKEHQEMYIPLGLINHNSEFTQSKESDKMLFSSKHLMSSSEMSKTKKTTSFDASAMRNSDHQEILIAIRRADSNGKNKSSKEQQHHQQLSTSKGDDITDQKKLDSSSKQSSRMSVISGEIKRILNRVDSSKTPRFITLLYWMFILMVLFLGVTCTVLSLASHTFVDAVISQITLVNTLSTEIIVPLASFLSASLLKKLSPSVLPWSVSLASDSFYSLISSSSYQNYHDFMASWVGGELSIKSSDPRVFTQQIQLINYLESFDYGLKSSLKDMYFIQENINTINFSDDRFSSLVQALPSFTTILQSLSQDKSSNSTDELDSLLTFTLVLLIFAIICLVLQFLLILLPFRKCQKTIEIYLNNTARITEPEAQEQILWLAQTIQLLSLQNEEYLIRSLGHSFELDNLNNSDIRNNNNNQNKTNTDLRVSTRSRIQSKLQQQQNQQLQGTQKQTQSNSNEQRTKYLINRIKVQKMNFTAFIFVFLIFFLLALVNFLTLFLQTYNFAKSLYTPIEQQYTFLNNISSYITLSSDFSVLFVHALLISASSTNTLIFDDNLIKTDFLNRLQITQNFFSKTYLDITVSNPFTDTFKTVCNEFNSRDICSFGSLENNKQYPSEICKAQLNSIMVEGFLFVQQAALGIYKAFEDNIGSVSSNASNQAEKTQLMNSQLILNEAFIELAGVFLQGISHSVDTYKQYNFSLFLVCTSVVLLLFSLLGALSLKRIFNNFKYAQRSIHLIPYKRLQDDSTTRYLLKKMLNI